MTSCSLENPLAASTMIAHTTATKKRRTARRDSFFCKGVPTLTPRNRPIASVVVRLQAWAYLCGPAFPSSLRLTGRRCIESTGGMAGREQNESAYLGASCSERSSDSSDLSTQSSGKDNTSSSAFCDCRRAVGDVQTIAWASIIGKDQTGILAHRKGFTSEQSFIGLEVDSLGEPIAY
jgi:hypothetical protein